MNQKEFKNYPKAEKKPLEMENFGIKRVDNYFWLKDKKNQDVLEYINKENAYTEEVMASTKDLQQKIYDEIVGRMKEDDESYPYLNNGYYYYRRSIKGKQYPLYLRKEGSLAAKEEIVFDCNQMADGKNAFIFEDYEISPDNSKALYLYNETGSFAEYTLKIRDLKTGKDLDFAIEGVASMAWASDSNTIIYSEIDSALRSAKVYRTTITNNNPVLVYEEEDERFRLGVYSESSKQFIMLNSSSFTTSEIFYIPFDKPTEGIKSFLPREKDVEYSVYPHQDKLFIRYKDKENLNGKIYTCDLNSASDKSSWQEFYPHSADALIEDLLVHKDFVALELRKNGLINLHIINLNDNSTQDIDFPEPVYKASSVYSHEYETDKIRYTYTSLNRPSTLFEYNLITKETQKLKEQEIPSGFNPDDYQVERLWATAPDGVKVPMAIVYKKGLKKDGSNPALLYSYGSYGYSTDAYFRSSFYSLIDRGFIFGIAQIRGGSDLGEQWYEDGKLLKKKNTFTDFISCSEYLIKEKYTSPKKLTIEGGSAGGLLMGAVLNMRPDLYKAAIAAVPFVDVVNTMLDDTLPLTVGEYEQWGNPNEEEYFKYMLSYSPYDNIEKKEYPNILVTGGLNDSQVLFHEPTKYIAKLREYKTDDNILILHMDMDSGHGGATGRYDGIKDVAFEQAFLIKAVEE